MATPTSVAAVPSSLSSSSSSFQQLALQAPASPLSKFGAGSNSSSTWDSPLRPPDSPGLGQHGVKPKDLLPEHAKALQEEFPNALPPGWQQMASWRMVEERLRVVAVEGAVFSKRRQMWRDRRKHYQVLTAQALAAAARSAANDAAAADAAAVGEAASAGVAAAGEGGASGPCAAAASDSAASTDTALGAGGLSVHGEVSSREAAAQEQQEASACAGHMSNGMAPQQSAYQPLPGQLPVEQQVAATGTTGVPQEPQPLPPQPQQQQQAAPHQLALLQRHEHEDLVPEWQQQRGSLFGLSALPASSGVLDGQAGSTFSCDTASFCCSPIPAVTPSVLLSPLGPDALGTSAGTTPGTAAGGSSSLSTPLIFAGTAGPAVSRHPSGPLHQVPSSQSLAGMSPRATPQSTPMPTPRAAAAAAAMAAAAASSGAPVSAAMGPYGVMMGPLPADAAGGYSPVHYPGALGVPPRVPVGYGMPQQSSPLPHMAGSSMGAAGRGMPGGMMNMAGSPALYQQMLVAQRQSQLQQQLMLQSPYAPRAPPSTEGAAAGNPQMMLNMQMQQQHQARMQRQRRLEQAFMVQQASTRQQQAPVQPDDVGDTGELDDKLGVLGVLGLQ